MSKLAAGEGAWYFKDSNTLYKIYGQIKCDLPIDINNAYITGLDSSSDMIRSTSGNILKCVEEDPRQIHWGFTYFILPSSIFQRILQVNNRQVQNQKREFNKNTFEIFVQ
ncbi:hypothetical protein [Chryseobacterium oranimense]|uniref:hypothetical protein n=1 Tax=Chryseobacterium oranimense TaxID=421058 RepID=UPI0031D82DCA